MADYPITNFHFVVSFFDLPGATIEDIKFQSVSGLKVKMDYELYTEMGEDRFEHYLPTHAKYEHLILKRGVMPASKSGLWTWCQDAFNKGEHKPLNLTVQALGEKHIPVLTWKVVHALPLSWKFGMLDANGEEVLLETFELRYNYFEIIK